MDKKSQNLRKVANLDLSDLEKLPLERFNQIQLWLVDSTILGKVCAKIEKTLLTSPDSTTTSGRRWIWVAGRRRYSTVGPPSGRRWNVGGRLQAVFHRWATVGPPVAKPRSSLHLANGRGLKWPWPTSHDLARYAFLRYFDNCHDYITFKWPIHCK